MGGADYAKVATAPMPYAEVFPALEGCFCTSCKLAAYRRCAAGKEC